MPTEDLVYDVKLDTTSLAQQLEEVKRQVDTTLDQTLGSKLRESMFDFTSSISSRVTGFTENLTASTDLGFNRFLGDASKVNQQVQGQLSQVFSPEPVTPFIPPPATSTMGLITQSMGIGFDPRGALSPGEYQLRARNMLQKSATETTLRLGADIGGSMGGAAIGTILGKTFGSYGGPVGSFLGGIAGGFIGNVTAGELIDERRLATVIRKQSQNFYRGSFTEGESRQLSRFVRNLDASPDLVNQGYDRNEVVGLVQEFTNLGGLDTIKGAEDYRTRVKELLKVNREMTQILKMTTNDVVTTLGDLKDVIGTPGQIESQLFNISAASEAAKLQTRPVIEAARASMQMTAGTEISRNFAFTGVAQLTSEIESLYKQGNFNPFTYQGLGGPIGVAQALTGQAINYGQSSLGMLSMGARLGGYQGEGGIGAQLSAFGNLMQDPRNVIDLTMNRDIYMNAMQPEGLLNEQAFQAMSIMNQIPFYSQGGISSKEYAHFLTTQGVPVIQAKAAAQRLSTYFNQDFDNERIKNLVKQQYTLRPSPFGGLMNEIRSGIKKSIRGVEQDLARPIESAYEPIMGGLLGAGILGAIGLIAAPFSMGATLPLAGLGIGAIGGAALETGSLDTDWVSKLTGIFKRPVPDFFGDLTAEQDQSLIEGKYGITISSINTPNIVATPDIDRGKYGALAKYVLEEKSDVKRIPIVTTNPFDFINIIPGLSKKTATLQQIKDAGKITVDPRGIVTAKGVGIFDIRKSNPAVIKELIDHIDNTSRKNLQGLISEATTAIDRAPLTYGDAREKVKTARQAMAETIMRRINDLDNNSLKSRIKVGLLGGNKNAEDLAKYFEEKHVVSMGVDLLSNEETQKKIREIVQNSSNETLTKNQITTGVERIMQIFKTPKQTEEIATDILGAREAAFMTRIKKELSGLKLKDDFITTSNLEELGADLVSMKDGKRKYQDELGPISKRDAPFTRILIEAAESRRIAGKGTVLERLNRNNVFTNITTFGELADARAQTEDLITREAVSTRLQQLGFKPGSTIDQETYDKMKILGNSVRSGFESALESWSFGKGQNALRVVHIDKDDKSLVRS